MAQTPMTPPEIASLIGDRLRILHDAPDSRGAQPRVVVSGNGATPWELLRIVDETIPAYKLWMLNAHTGIPVRDGVVHESPFVGPGMRKLPSLRYTPARLSLVPTLFRGAQPPDIVVIHTSVPYDGKVSLGIEINVVVAAIEAVKARGGLLIAQTNPQMPYTFGDGEIYLDDIDGFIEVDASVEHKGHRAPSTGEAADAARVIGELCSRRVRDGATLQLGIGEVPDATLEGLSKLRGLGIWSEMVSDGLLRLDGAGALDQGRLVIASFAMGTNELYRWMHRNPRLRMRRTEITNDPANVAKQPQMTSINTALQVDLLSQANASRIRARIHSGFGGQTDFIVGAIHAPGGQALMALRSWHPKADVSTIVPLIDEPVTSFQHSAVVTEYGVAEVFGQDERTQARNIIEHAAHPRVREELWEEAHELGLA